MELTTGSILSIVETTKESRASFIAKTVDAVKEGDINPLQAWVHLKNWETLIKDMLGDAELKDMALTEIAKYGSKEFERFNATVKVGEVGTAYNFAACNDPIWADLKEQALSAAAKLKDREAFLKAIPLAGVEILHGDELITVYPPTKTSVTSPIVKLK